MDLARVAIDRPFATAVVFLMAVLLGGYALMRLPVDLMPDITYPRLTINTTYEGVGPEEIETLITRPVEEAVAAVQGLEEITSHSGEGRSQVRLGFRWGTNLDAAAEDLRARIDRIRSRLPEGAAPPSLLKFDLAAFPVVFLALTGQLGPLELKDLAEDQIKPRLERLPGVAAVDLRGALFREIRVEVDRHRLAGLGLTLDAVVSALGRESIDAPAGELRQTGNRVALRLKGAYANVAAIGDVPVAARSGAPVRVRDFAVVVDGYQELRSSVRVDGTPTLMMAVRKQSGSNTVAVAEAVGREVVALNRDLRTAQVWVRNDTSRFIKRSIDHLSKDLLAGSCLAIGVLLFFLRSIRTTLVVATAIPISVIATFGLLYSQGMTLNIMSLGGLALGVGRLVDDAIVVIESIHRHRAAGKAPADAALFGTRQVALAIVASTATTVAVFVPLVFLGGMSGVMFKQLALVVAFALVCSLLVAQALIPMFASRFLGSPDASPGRGPLGWLSGRTADIHASWERAYVRSLDAALGRPGMVVAVAAVLVGGSLALAPHIGREFMPQTDEGEVRLNVEMAPGTPLETLEEHTDRIVALIRREVPETRSIIADLGGGGWRVSGSHTGSLQVLLEDLGTRKRSSEAIATDLRRKIGRIPGVRARVNAGGSVGILHIGQVDGGGRLGVQIRGHDFEVARALADQVEKVMATTPGVAGVRQSRSIAQPEAAVFVDRERAAALGLSIADIARTLEAGVLGKRAAFFREAGDEHPIVVRLRDDQRAALDGVLGLPVALPGGRQVTLRDVVSVRTGEGPAQIDREGQERVLDVTGELEGQSLGAVSDDLARRLRSIHVPAGFAIVQTGDVEEQIEAFRELMAAVGLAVLLVFLVMVAQFESVRQPFAILLSIPACVTGVVLALLGTGTTLNVQSFIGLIVLVGVAVSNGIVMVDYMNQLRRHDGMTVAEAVREGARIRLRPVLMTTLTTILAMVPMSLGLGDGGELQSPMARVIIGGLLSSTLITLYLVPVAYRWLEREGRGPAAKEAVAPVPDPLPARPGSV